MNKGLSLKRSSVLTVGILICIVVSYVLFSYIQNQSSQQLEPTPTPTPTVTPAPKPWIPGFEAIFAVAAVIAAAYLLRRIKS